jgi:hypothetical protein
MQPIDTETSLSPFYATYIRRCVEDHRDTLDLNGIMIVDGYYNPESSNLVDREKQAFLRHFNERAYLAHESNREWVHVPLIERSANGFTLDERYDKHQNSFLEKYFPEHNTAQTNELLNWFLTSVFDDRQLNNFENSLNLDDNRFLEVDPFDIAVMVQKYGANLDFGRVEEIKALITSYNYFDFESPSYISYTIQPSGQFSLRLIGSDVLIPSRFLVRDFIIEQTNLLEALKGFNYFFEISRFTAYHSMQRGEALNVMTEISKLLFLIKEQFSEQNTVFFAEMAAVGPKPNKIVKFLTSAHRFYAEAREIIKDSIKANGYENASMPNLNILAPLDHSQSLIEFK